MLILSESQIYLSVFACSASWKGNFVLRILGKKRGGGGLPLWYQLEGDFCFINNRKKGGEVFPCGASWKGIFVLRILGKMGVWEAVRRANYILRTSLKTRTETVQNMKKAGDDPSASSFEMPYHFGLPYY